MSAAREIQNKNVISRVIAEINAHVPSGAPLDEIDPSIISNKAVKTFFTALKKTHLSREADFTRLFNDFQNQMPADVLSDWSEKLITILKGMKEDEFIPGEGIKIFPDSSSAQSLRLFFKELVFSACEECIYNGQLKPELSRMLRMKEILEKMEADKKRDFLENIPAILITAYCINLSFQNIFQQAEKSIAENHDLYESLVSSIPAANYFMVDLIRNGEFIKQSIFEFIQQSLMGWAEQQMQLADVKERVEVFVLQAAKALQTRAITDGAEDESMNLEDEEQRILANLNGLVTIAEMYRLGSYTQDEAVTQLASLRSERRNSMTPKKVSGFTWFKPAHEVDVVINLIDETQRIISNPSSYDISPERRRTPGSKG